MKKLFLIPVMALLVVLGMSFTNLGSEIEEQPKVVASDYVYDNGNWQAVPEQTCTGGTQTCRVQFGTSGPIYDLYDEMDLATKKRQSDGTIIILE
ncbi:MAG: hypothetical protein CMP12_11440 [Zunongwangia sp.]|uniref:DUF6520 family protein n=2 Tax=Zunongwangia profunda TaxID=398743 RepID=UPI000C923021|nr:DUF6520 family protein [Zunongwangia profunda]MAG86161.1 hypothetical protein [Flavobacteriaceae bacterium]MAO36497.1 hypothetical protein [Zunongwangia sp.]|tara:strand:- start:2659 stop:2943 length:285 start_codon:yes stop_codon:yes gene_type:complete